MSLLEVKNLRTYFHTRAGTSGQLTSFLLHQQGGNRWRGQWWFRVGHLPPCSAFFLPPQRWRGGLSLRQPISCTSPHHSSNHSGKTHLDDLSDPMSCLNPYLPILEQVVEPILTENVSRKQAELRAIEMMTKVEFVTLKLGLTPTLINSPENASTSHDCNGFGDRIYCWQMNPPPPWM